MSESTAERVAALLLAFDTARGQEVSVSDLARAIGRERTQVSRMLKSLQRGGLVEQNEENRSYRLSWRLRALAANAGNDQLVRACTPVLQALVAKTGEVALLSVQEGSRSLTVLREESHQSLRAGGWVGRRSPLYCTASGRAMLFDSDNEHIEALTENDFLSTSAQMASPKNLAELLAKLHQERRQGFSVAAEEVEVGLTSVSAPVRDQLGHIVGVINVSGPSARLSGRIESTGKLLMTAATQVSKRLRASH